MKQCPKCSRTYADETLNFCLDDGEWLLSGDEPTTAILHETNPVSEAETRAQIHATDRSARLPEIVPRPNRGLSKKIAAALVIAIIGVGAFFAYRNLRPGTAGRIDSIAVMPFVNGSGNSDIEYLSDGVTESLINNLSQLPDLSVKARSSVFRYKGKDVEPQQVAADLNVQAVLNGRVTQRGDNMTFSLDLVDGATGNQIWGEQYTRKSGDLAVLQSEIARDVSGKLRARLTGAEEAKVVKNQTQDSEAYQLYLQGRYNWNQRTGPTIKKAIEFFQQAVEKDPNYAMAYVGLAESYVLSDLSPDEKAAKVKAAALKALEIDPNLGEAHVALAGVRGIFERDFPGAEQGYRQAIKLSPNYATAYHWYAEDLSQQGRFDESLPLWKKALELDPFSLAIGTDYGLEYLYYSRKYDEAADYLKKLTDMEPNYVRTHFYLATVYETMGRYEEAINEHKKRVELVGLQSEEIQRTEQEVRDAFRTHGPKGYWSKILELSQQEIKKGEKIPAFNMASIYARLGKRDEAFEWLETAYENNAEELVWMKVDPAFDGLRDDPKFTDLLKRLKLQQ